MTVGDLIRKLRRWMLKWLDVPDYREVQSLLTQETDRRLEHDRLNSESIIELTARVETLENAYANDPRRAEIEKQKAEQPITMGGFTPRSKRIAVWQAERRAKPKTE